MQFLYFFDLSIFSHKKVLFSQPNKTWEKTEFQLKEN